ncbi:hypothetical protein [Homoserinimonas hongtaonis]|uniref:hypothetical protein n=1 Tax=Homoserinimonas hongtaonis TaxID=2079791 RepID=UPI001304E2C4|nr:hypothetical protein [Salinibacterium hongtaonis]
MNIWWDAALWLLVLWLSALLFQIADIGTAWFDSRTARAGSARFARRRAHEIFWVLPVAALAAVLSAFGVALGASMVLDTGWGLTGGLVLALAVMVIVSGLVVVGLVRLLTRDVQGYAVLRLRVSDTNARKVTKADIERWRQELAVIDEREAVRHESIARWLRLIPIAFSVLALAAIWIALAQDFSLPTGLIVGLVSLLLPAISIVLADRAARLSLRARAEWALVNGRQRAELVQAIDELERRTNRGVAGLSDRVNRALQILREQQL